MVNVIGFSGNTSSSSSPQPKKRTRIQPTTPDAELELARVVVEEDEDEDEADATNFFRKPGSFVLGVFAWLEDPAGVVTLPLALPRCLSLEDCPAIFLVAGALLAGVFVWRDVFVCTRAFFLGDPLLPSEVEEL